MDRDQLLKILRKQFKSVIPEKSERPAPTEFIPSGILSLDWALNGGFPRGHISHIWGPDGGGKTTSMIPVVLSAQRNPLINGVVLYIATEPKVDPALFFSMGVDPDKIVFARTRNKEEILDGNVAMNMIRQAAGEVDLIILDSVAGLSPKVIYEMESEDYAIGKVANLLSNQLPLIANITAATKTAVIFLNQQRASFQQYGLDVKPFAGYALKHWICNSAMLRSSGWIKRGKDKVVGFKPLLTVNKNDFGEPRRSATWDWLWDGGVDLVSQAFDFAKQLGLITASGFVKLGDTPLNHPGERTIEDAKARLHEEPELAQLVYDAVMHSGNAIDLLEDSGTPVDVDMEEGE